MAESRVKPGCGKRAYTKEDAKKNLIRIRKRPRQRGVRTESRVYYCRVCDAWHLTSTKDIRPRDLNSNKKDRLTRSLLIKKAVEEEDVEIK